MSSTSPYSAGGAGFVLLPRRTVARAAASGGRRETTALAVAAAEGPSCLFVGPIDSASKEMLEALYCQARDSYYSGKPLIVDDMFDKVELKLRLYGSKYVVKYPRCSIRRQLTYADAEEDQSLVFALVSIWLLLFTFGTSAFLVPAAFSVNSSLRDAFTSIVVLDQWRSPLDTVNAVSNMFLMGVGYLIGYPIASASVKALQGLWTNDLVALKGSCPNCGEEFHRLLPLEALLIWYGCLMYPQYIHRTDSDKSELVLVFAFVKTNDKSRQSPHRAECHVCQSRLEYRTKVEQSMSGPRRSWVYGRIYLVQRA